MMPAGSHLAPEKEDNMTGVHILAIDLAKRSFQVCAMALGKACVDAPGLARRFSDDFNGAALLSVVCQAS